MKWVLGIIDRLFVLIGALAFSQLPMFIQQYMHQLAGHEAELHYQVQKLEEAAQSSNLTIVDYIHKFSSHGDPDFARQGQMMQSMLDRFSSFHQSLISLEGSSYLGKPVIFMTNLNLDVAKATWQSFSFGLSFSPEGIVYAFFGGIIGFLLFRSVVWAIGSIANLLTPRKAPSLHD